MPRPIDPERHRARRLAIIDAALTCFSHSGYDGAKVADICREAEIGSGTFFHYFPAKLDVLLGILEFGTEETAEFFASLGAESGTDAILAYVAHEAESLADYRAAGFIRAVAAVSTNEQVAKVLRADEERVRRELEPWVERGMAQGAIRSDISAPRIVGWVHALVDGFAGQIAEGRFADTHSEIDVLFDTVRRFLAS